MKTKLTSKKWLKYKLGKAHLIMENRVERARKLLYLCLKEL